MAKGVGVGLRHQFLEDTDNIFKHVDFLEYNQKGGLSAVKKDLGPFVGKLPIVIHSINLSLGSVEPPSQQRLDLLKETVEFVKPSWVSEHLSYSRFEDIEIENFICMPFTDEAIEVVSANIKTLQRHLGGMPIAMENVTHTFTWPGKQYTEAEFLKRVMETADCGMLLDVTNLYLNSRMHGYDPYEYLESLPKERIMQLHLAGHTEDEGNLIDSHVGGIHPEVLGYAEWVLKHTPCEALIIERDSDLQGFDDMLPDLQISRDLYTKYRQPVRR
jgi:uncharacterized protein (UPF0276 family)